MTRRQKATTKCEVLSLNWNGDGGNKRKGIGIRNTSKKELNNEWVFRKREKVDKKSYVKF